MLKIVVICGPTGIGKTSFAINTANRFNGEIIGADSMQIYKYLDIGTAKPDPDELKQAKHHLVDFVDPAEEYDAGRYVKEADSIIHDLAARGRLPIVAGGTGLYIKALVHGLFRSKPICAETMQRLNMELEKSGARALHSRLKVCDPEAAERIHPNDSFRVIRALEVFETTGGKISQSQSEHGFDTPRYRALKFGLYMERDQLYERINKRVDLMLEAGLLDEVKQLYRSGYSFDLKSMQSIGYKHMGMFLKDEVEWNEAVRLLKRDTRRYAKRQFTWFNKDKEIHWVKPAEFKKAEVLIKEFLT